MPRDDAYRFCAGVPEAYYWIATDFAAASTTDEDDEGLGALVGDTTGDTLSQYVLVPLWGSGKRLIAASVSRTFGTNLALLQAILPCSYMLLYMYWNAKNFKDNKGLCVEI